MSSVQNNRMAMVIAAMLIGVAMSASADVIDVFYGASIPTELGGGTATVDDMFIQTGGSSQRNNNHGISPVLGCGYAKVNGGQGAARAFMRFDLSFLDGQYASIDSATLTLSHFRSLDTGNETASWIELNIMNMIDSTDWVAGTKDAATATAGDSSWNYKNNPDVWNNGSGTVDGLDYKTADAVKLGIRPNDSGGVKRSVALPTGWLEGWITGVNGGLAIRNPNENDGYNWGIISSEGTWGDQYLPTLTIEYTPIPEPATTVVLLLGSLFMWRKRK